MSSAQDQPSALLPQRRQSTNMIKDEDTDLTQSLKQLSLSTSSVPVSPRFTKAPSPLQISGSRQSSPPPPPLRRPSSSSRSPSNGRASREPSPTLARKASANSIRSATGGSNGGAVATQNSSRRSSFVQSVSSPKLKPSNAGFPEIQEKPPLTPEMLARSHFEAELQSHHSLASAMQAETVVILNDAVYGHRFSRPRTSRTALSTIVERPERIQAAVLGISTAYVRLGERHPEGEHPINPGPDVVVPPTVPFRIHKTERRVSLLSQAVANVHGNKWMEELTMMCDSAEAKLAMGGKELQRPEMNRGPDHPRPEKLHEGDLYLCSESKDAMEGALGAVCEAVDLAFGSGPRRAFVGVRPPGHHCSASHPSGFCWVNNVHVGIMHAALEHRLTHAAIIDFDLHHGDGSQDITWEHNTRSLAASKNAASWKRSSIGYFSIHDINSYPCEGGDPDKVKNASLCIDNAHGQSVWNVHLQSWNTEADFWQLYESKYSILLEKTRSYLRTQSQRVKALNQESRAAIFISAGFDASEWEGAGMQRHQVNVPTEFYARLTQDIIKLAAEEGLGTDGRVISVLEGGYSDRALMSGILSHISGLVADQKPKQPVEDPRELATGPINETEPALSQADARASVHAYDPSWWAPSELERLEHVEVSCVSPPKKTRPPLTASYSSPTQASVARAVDPVKARLSFSGLSGAAAPAPVVPRGPTPPPPDVPWTIAARVLSKLLIPSNRQTDSCKAEDLNAEATRARRERQSMLAGIPTAAAAAAAAPNPNPAADRPTSRMSLRERRAKPVPKMEDRIAEQASKNRRKTVAVTGLPVDKTTARSPPPDSNGVQVERRASRRLSGSAALFGTIDNSHQNPETPREEASFAIPPLPSTVPSAKPTSSRVTVKKPRAPAATRKEPVAKTQRANRKAATPPLPAVEPGSSNVENPGVAGPEAPPLSTPTTEVDGLEQITSGMKKIRINLITQSQKEERERARQEAKKAASSPISEPPMTALQPTTALHEGQSQATPAAWSSSPTTPQEPHDTQEGIGADSLPALRTVGDTVSIPAAPAAAAGDMSTPIQEAFSSDILSPELPPNHHRDYPASAFSPTVPVLAVQPSSDPADVFIPYQPDGPAPVAVAQTEALRWLPPNAAMSSATTTPAATPSPVKRQDKSGLFQYKAGSIPFAPRGQGMSPSKGSGVGADAAKGENLKRGGQESGSVWDVPETPHKGPDTSD